MVSRSIVVLSAAVSATIRQSPNPAERSSRGLIPPLNGLPLGTVNGQQKNEYEGWGVSGNIDFDASEMIQVAINYRISRLAEQLHD